MMTAIGYSFSKAVSGSQSDERDLPYFSHCFLKGNIGIGVCSELKHRETHCLIFHTPSRELPSNTVPIFDR